MSPLLPSRLDRLCDQDNWFRWQASRWQCFLKIVLEFKVSYESSGSAPDSCVKQWSDRSTATHPKISVKVHCSSSQFCIIAFLPQGTVNAELRLRARI